MVTVEFLIAPTTPKAYSVVCSKHEEDDMATQKRGLGSDKLTMEQKRAIWKAGGKASGAARRKNRNT